MVETVEVILAPARRMILPLVIGAAIALFVITAIGTVVGLVLFRLVDLIYREANSALGAAAFVVNFLTAVLSYLFVRWLARKGDEPESEDAFLTLLRQNIHFLKIAEIATIFVCVEAIFAFVRQEVSSFVVVQIGNATQIDFLHGAWTVALGFVLPVALLFLLLVAAPKLRRAQAPGA